MAEAAKKHKVSEPPSYAWRKHFGQTKAADVKGLKALEQENARLKRLLAEAALDIEVLEEINAKERPRETQHLVDLLRAGHRCRLTVRERSDTIGAMTLRSIS